MFKVQTINNNFINLMKTPTRRKFLKGSILGAAGASSFCSLPANAKPKGANGDLRVAVIGCGGRGGGHVNACLNQKGVRIAALCDADYKRNEGNSNNVAKKQGSKPKLYEDYRELCADKDIDAVMIATPNHLHSLIAILAAQNGKHVYVEKPVSHNIWEGRKLVETSEKYGKKGVIVQHGMQRRSDTGWRDIMEWIKDKPLGEMLVSRGFCYKPRKSIGKVDKPQQPPAEINYDLWSGPREILPVRRGRFHYDWHWQRAYGNGDIGNQGPHQMDVARWALGQEKCAPNVLSIGGRFGYDDDGDTANTQIAFFDYKPVPLIFEVRGLPEKGLDWGKGMSNYKGARVGNVIEFEGGYVSESKAYDQNGKSMKKFGVTNGRGHLENWIAAIREGIKDGRHELELSAHTGHISAALGHMANISYYIGSESTKEEAKASLKGEKMKEEVFDRFAAHLDNNGIDIKKTHATAGPLLTFDPDKEQFTGKLADRANKLVKGDYRAGFTIPDTI
jgi:predicted dehydrogenase